MGPIAIRQPIHWLTTFAHAHCSDWTGVVLRWECLATWKCGWRSVRCSCSRRSSSTCSCTSCCARSRRRCDVSAASRHLQSDRRRRRYRRRVRSTPSQTSSRSVLVRSCRNYRPVFRRLPEPNRAWPVSCIFFTLDQSAFGILIT